MNLSPLWVVWQLVAAPVAPPPDFHTPPIVRAQVRLTAAPPLGAIPIAFLRNQAQYCDVICPFIVQGVVTLPLAAAQTPVAFLNALTTNALTTTESLRHLRIGSGPSRPITAPTEPR
ncbi:MULTISPECIES: hypothetical protein [unclassified Mycolicibacterium]|uniref:hypothetical protein n=1 Tax=unclassified Mycolicibacterium TaxID=2636767 RepID=UPI0012DEFC9C|nr:MULTISPECIES: hypothetical protein [unclassified Mycolicibacterium]MUL83607.1 hypothetical protein [Mycolicibacterium sp. CBMA 329]MUL90598.1 hypothetical protein [Mycolicibacterium sp. CBMA 331]MUM00568.1 hypothetical protein [Mycolicibacterium sp. CBMA 334]MUM25460.1 hypothetical protein [Mycolicibacterium sp. CBMA 295]MUM41542.1 hypothetical protein [Mycolicibacterium sp. CBMA 247]